MNDIKSITNQIKNRALELGFDDIGVAKAAPAKEFENHLHSWLHKGFHADMAYMQQNTAVRTNPGVFFPGAKSVIVVVVNYNLGEILSQSRFKVARFAHVTDYHHVIKSKLEELLGFVRHAIPESDGQFSVDAQPVAERYWAVQAGLGFIGQNTLFIHPKLGSFVFLGTLIVNAELEYDQPNTQACLGCGACLQRCPNKAIVEPYVVDARRCISYLTIESKAGSKFQEGLTLDNYIFGCDTCNLVCPHNQDIPLANADNFTLKPEASEKTDDDWLALGSNPFKRQFSRSPLRRAGLRGIRRNIEWSLKNKRK
jgi:epoxyqueuosine reductase